jgi:sensor histidine kinase YesM
MEIFFALGLFVFIVIALRLFGAWMLRINEIIKLQTSLREHLLLAIQSNTQELKKIRELLEKQIKK